MLDPKSVINGAIPPADARDLQRFWSIQSQDPAQSGVAYSANAMLQICESKSADPVIVWARTVLIRILLQQGVLENWRENDDLHVSVFQSAAVFPLPNGLQGINPSEFIATLPV